PDPSSPCCGWPGAIAVVVPVKRRRRCLSSTPFERHGASGRGPEAQSGLWPAAGGLFPAREEIGAPHGESLVSRPPTGRLWREREQAKAAARLQRESQALVNGLGHNVLAERAEGYVTAQRARKRRPRIRV
ncbi:hypothetical protein chiPu_0029232, partial [Chiloscyllium punctatum]|nr:hypothetical protein [Chiloscyllium punctatum]